MKIPQNATWTVQKLLQLRSVVQPWITYVRVMFMDHDTFLWWDNWHPVGPLYLRYRDSFERNPIRAMNVKVSSIIANGCWNWPRLRNFVTQDIISHTPVMFLPHMGCNDSICWALHSSGLFSTKIAWEAIKNKAPTVPWHRVLWFSHYVPRWAIIEWLALLGRLATKDKLHAWWVISDDGFVLCDSAHETHVHLFYHCAYSAQIWDFFLHENGIHRAGLGLFGEVNWMVQHCGDSGFKHSLLKLSLAVVVYGVWKERNCKFF